MLLFQLLWGILIVLIGISDIRHREQHTMLDRVLLGMVFIGWGISHIINAVLFL